MNTQKVAISLPPDLLSSIDGLIKKRGISRSRFITTVLREKMEETRSRELKDAYDRVYSDEAIRKEQLETADFLEGVNHSEGQEW